MASHPDMCAQKVPMSTSGGLGRARDLWLCTLQCARYRDRLVEAVISMDMRIPVCSCRSGEQCLCRVAESALSIVYRALSGV